MTTTLLTRKPIDQLQADDLLAFPIWEFASDEESNDDDDEQDETWVRPLAAHTIAADMYSLSVAANFTCASGATFPGFLGVSTDEGFEVGCAVLLPAGKYLFVPQDPEDFPMRMALLQALQMQESAVFPLRYELRVLLEGEQQPRNGQFD